jgi:hypothetical protein
MKKQKKIAVVVAVAMLATMIPIMAFASLDSYDFNGPEDPFYLKSDVEGSVPVSFRINTSDRNDASAQVSLFKGALQISSIEQNLDIKDKRWRGIVNLPVPAGTMEGAYDLKVSVTHEGDNQIYTYSDRIRIDNTSPTASINDLDNGGEMNISETIVIDGTASDSDLIGTAIDGSGVTSVAVTITGPKGYSVSPTVTGITNWSVDWTAPTVPGIYTVSARAADAAGNLQSVADTVTLFVGVEAEDHFSITMQATTGGTGPCI